jgi:hypothetical protein
MKSFLLLPLLVACAATDPEEVVSIDQGVYGLTISGCDTSDCEDGRYEHALVYATPAGAADYLMTKSDGDGFFELALPAGTYEICVHACIDVTVGDGERVRRDFISGPGGGIWCDDDGCRPR